MHPSGPKRDYDWHTCAFDRAMEAGIDDVGAGVLFGLYDYKFEVLALLLHALHLEEVFGVGPHTISVPRMRPARGVSLETFHIWFQMNPLKNYRYSPAGCPLYGNHTIHPGKSGFPGRTG